MEKKRLLFVISQLHLGGAETSTVEIIKKIPKEIYDIDLIVMNQVPVQGAVSLIPKIPEWVNVCDAFHERMKALKPVRHFMIKWADNAYFPEIALRFVQKKNYDLAVHIGEWWAPTFLSLVVNAKKKAVWIHTDIASAPSFQPNLFFAYTERIHKYLFVSEHSRLNACEKFSFLKDRSGLLHNMVDQEAIRQGSMEKADAKRSGQMPLVVSVANIRPEKGHMRALEAMRLLRDRKRKFVWWNIGFESYKELTEELKQKIEDYGLSNQFMLLGAKKNPYPFMAQADAVASLSDYESWSMVITEAKSLGVPVIATKTSGALEQIEHGVTGHLTDAEPDVIADSLEKLLFNSAYNRSIRRHLEQNPALFDAVAELDAVVNEPCQDEIPGGDRILYVIDDVNYRGGAHVAVYNHIDTLLRRGRKVDIYSGTTPSWELRKRFPGVRFWTYDYSEENRLCMRRVFACYTDNVLKPEDKSLRYQYWKQKKNINFLYKRRFVYAQDFFSRYETVCLLSEGSMFKDALADCTAANKIQWIHTDYCSWREVSWYTRNLAREDPERWEKITKIVVLSPLLKRSLIQLFPQFESKICVAGNLMDEERIRSRAVLEQQPREDSASKAQPVRTIEAVRQQKYAGKGKKGKDSRHPKSASRRQAVEAVTKAVEAKAAQAIERPKVDPAVLALLKGMDGPELQFVSCFRFEPVKNAPLIIRAVARLAQQTRDFHWTFIGDGEEFAQVKQAVDAAGLNDVVTFAGQQSNPFPMIKKADVFVQFSKYEGLPNTIYEALILGTPVLSSNVGAIADQIVPGETGWLVAPKEDALFEALLYIVNHPAIAKKYKQNLSDYHFDNNTVVRQLEEIFPA